MSTPNIPQTSGKFSNWEDYESLREWLKQSDDWEEVAVSDPRSNVGLHEAWHRCKPTGVIWRLIEPDAPYPGVWEQVSSR